MWAYCYVHKTLIKHIQAKKKANNIHAHCTGGHMSNQVQLAAMLKICSWHDPGWLQENMLLQAFAGSWGLCAGSGSEHSQIKLSIWHSQFKCASIEKNAVSGIRLIGQKYRANLVSEPAKLLGAWRRCLHASADSRTGACVTRSACNTVYTLYLCTCVCVFACHTPGNIISYIPVPSAFQKYSTSQGLLPVHHSL